MKSMMSLATTLLLSSSISSAQSLDLNRPESRSAAQTVIRLAVNDIQEAFELSKALGASDAVSTEFMQEQLERRLAVYCIASQSVVGRLNQITISENNEQTKFLIAARKDLKVVGCKTSTGDRLTSLAVDFSKRSQALSKAYHSLLINLGR